MFVVFDSALVVEGIDDDEAASRFILGNEHRLDKLHNSRTIALSRESLILRSRSSSVEPHENGSEERRSSSERMES